MTTTAPTTTTKITPTIRREAAELLSAQANLFLEHEWPNRDDITALEEQFFAEANAFANQAFFATPSYVHEDSYDPDDEIPAYLQFAEAEAWVLSGWEKPGDEKEFV